MDKFVPSIKKKYRDRLINYGKNWPPCHSDKLVRLELVQKEKGGGYSINTQRDYEGKSVERTPLAYGDLFKVEDGKQTVRKVLVEGDAGIGKTTLSISISEGWACETLFRNFDLLLLLPLRHKEVASASSLSDLLKLLHPSSGICKSVATYLEEDEGEKVLIIADGWDELVESKRSEESFLFHLLFERFPLMSVVVTSRHFASASFHSLSCIDRYAEIRGFHKEDIREYIQSEFLNNQEKACHLLEQLEGNPLVESVCSVPLNCAIICHLWHTLDETFPSTMTELYTKVVLNIILRNIQKNDEYKSILKLSNFNALPEDLRQSFWHLCRFAFEALKKGVIVFAEEELTEFFPQGLEKIHCFGLLQSAVTVLETGLGVSFHFLHLTFMEYLAALHLAKLPRCAQHEMLEVRSQKVNKSSHLAITWRFFFGIYFSDSNVNTEDVKWAINSCVTGSSSKALALCQCAFEAKSDVINREVVSIIDTKTVYPYNSYDSAAALYVIANMEKCSDIVMEFTSGRIMAKQVRTLTDTLVNKQGKLQFKELNLIDNKLNDECVSDLFHRASTAFQSVAKVSLRGNRIGANAMKTISKTLAFSSKACELCSLDLSCNALGVSGLQALIDSVRTQLFCNLKVLRIEETLTGSDTDANASLLSTLIESVSTHCPSLRHVYLSQNNLGVPGASAMARVMVRLLRHSPLTLIQHSEGKAVLSKIYVQKPQFLSFLSLGRTGLGDIGLHVFVNSLRVVRLYVLQWLDLRGNDIHAFGMSCLAEAVCSGKVVITNLLGESNVDLDGNPLGLEGCVLVCRMLGSRHFKPHTLSLSDCQLTTAGAGLLGTGSFNVNDSTLCEAQRHVCQQLCRYSQNCCITCLFLSGSSFTGEGVGILAGFMYLCVSLRQLYTRGCGIDSDDIKQLLDKLLQLKHSSPNICTMLESWILSDNKIDDAGVSQLIDQLPTLFPRLGCGISGCILFGNNPASKEMQIKLEKEWNKRVKKVSCYENCTSISPYSFPIHHSHTLLYF